MGCYGLSLCIKFPPVTKCRNCHPGADWTMSVPRKNLVVVPGAGPYQKQDSSPPAPTLGTEGLFTTDRTCQCGRARPSMRLASS